MKKVRITVKKMACYHDLIGEYENPIEHACGMELGRVFVAEGWRKPAGFCQPLAIKLCPSCMEHACWMGFSYSRLSSG